MHETKYSAPASNLPTIAVFAGLLAITLLGLFVRLYGLTSYGLWFDEAYHIELIKLPTIGTMLDAVLSNPPSDPLYVLLLRGWSGLFGTDATGVRSLSVLLGTATIPATFFLGRYTLGAQSGLLGALFFALSPYAVEFGQEAALYGLAALFTTIAIALGWRWLRTGRGIATYTALGVLSIYSHYVVAVIMPLFAALILLLHIRDRATGKRWILANGLILVSWLPWLLALLAHWFNADLPRASIKHPATIEEVVGGVIQFTSGTAALLQTQRPLQIAGLALGLILLMSSWFVRRQEITIMFGLFGIVYLVPALISSITGMWLFVPHFMLFLLPALLVCLSGLVLSVRSIRLASLSIIQALGLLTVAGWLVVQCWGIVLYNKYPPHGADGLQELASVLNKDYTDDQEVFVTPPALMPMLTQYYNGDLTGLPEDFDLRRVYIPFDAQDWYTRSYNAIVQAMPGHTSFWLLYRPELDEGGRLLSQLRSKYELDAEEHYIFSDLYHFSVKP